MKNTLQVGAIIMLTFLLGACTNNNEPTVDAKPVPRPVEDTLVGFKGCDKTSFHPLSAYTFDYKYPNYVVRVMERSDTSGIGITVFAWRRSSLQHHASAQWNIRGAQPGYSLH
ncbi:MAG: hypothetical protein R2792_00535 [Saprospiraceae bacterium]